MTWVKPRNYVKFYYATEPDDDGNWNVWIREFLDSTCETPVTPHQFIESYKTAEAAEAAANEFQAVSNQ
jgi:hypothetical protein